MHIIVVAGISGSGKTTVMNTLEDRGYFCVEHLPYFLLAQTLSHIESAQQQYGGKIAISLDSLSFLSQGKGWAECAETLRQQHHIDYWFLFADNDVLITRYNETRRRHPYSLSALPLERSISDEFDALSVYAHQANRCLDTSRLSMSALRELVENLLSGNLSSQSQTSLQIHLFSFGFKYGMPAKADYVFDVRCLPNPYWDIGLRKYNGLQTPIIDFMRAHPQVEEMIHDIEMFLEKWCQAYQKQSRSYLDIAIGCTGGQHRSVYIVENIAKKLSKNYPISSVNHRELTKIENKK